MAMMKEKNRISCPACGSHNVAYYLYGMPVMNKELEQGIENHKIICAGCGVSDNDPEYHCNDCGEDFGYRE